MADKLTINLTGLEEFERRINNFSDKLATVLDKKETRMAIGEILIARARKTIKSGGTGLETPWAPIKEQTINRRWEQEQKKKPAQRTNKQGIVSNAPLQRTGAGLQSLNYALRQDGLVLQALKYMGYQHTGTKPYTIKPKDKKALLIPGIGFRQKVNHPGLPARPFFVVLPEDIEDIKAMIIDDIKKMA